MTADHKDRFEIISQLAIQSARGANVAATAETALKLAADYVGLEAVTLILWNDKNEPSLSVSHARSEHQKQRLSQIESELFASLRKKHRLASAYMSFGGDHPYHSFTLPLEFQGVIRGAVIGIQEGERRIVSENLLLEALAALLALVHAAEKVGQSTEVSGKKIEEERLAAIVETAVTINHEVNNPLTAVLGNVQLLLLKRDDLDPELVTKLKVIEESAMKIKDITQKLLRIKSVKSKEYTEGTRMLDLSDDEDD